MKNILFATRNGVTGLFYRLFLKPLLFLFDPEDVHDRMVSFGAALGRSRPLRFLTRAVFGYADAALEQKILGMEFKNPLCLAAGFDKNAELTDILPSVGFAAEEVGSITGEMCPGNPKPRLWRLKKSQGLLVYYGLKNNGAAEISGRLSKKRFGNIIGTSVAMTNNRENMNIENAIGDYVKAFNFFTDIGDYFTVNISCPNTEGGQPFVEPENLDKLLASLDPIPTRKPVFVKLSPDLSTDAVDRILEILRRHRVQGIIVTNLTKKREIDGLLDKNLPPVGGISGKPVQKLSDDLLGYLYKKAGTDFVLVGCGGIFSAEDAYRKIRRGASLLQFITGMIYLGPQNVGEINRGIVKLLRRDGFRSIGETVGADFRK